MHALIKMDDDHYWADWTNSCPYTIDSVYVTVRFAGQGDPRGRQRSLGAALHHAGDASDHARQRAPQRARVFDRVRVHKITTDSEEALHEPPLLPTPPAATRRTGTVADPQPR